MMWRDAKQYVLEDPQASGNLFQNIGNDMTEDGDILSFSVFVDTSESGAPYAAVTEFGSGKKSETAHSGSRSFPAFRTGSAVPIDYPYSAPNVSNIEGFAYYIEEWMKQKEGIQPRHGDMRASATAIAKEIVKNGTYAHPYLRPAWFDNELKVKRAARNAIRNATR